MKKIALLLFLLSITYLCADEAKNSSFFDQSFYKVKPGDYVFYYDDRGEDPVLIGIKYLKENSYRVRYYDYSSDHDVSLTVSVDYTPKKISMSYDDYPEEDFDPESLMKYTGLFNTLINMQDRVDQSIFPNDPSFTQTYTKDDKKYKHVITYKYWVPVFQAYSIHQTEPEDKTVSLVAMAKESSENDKFFDTFKYFPREQKADSVSIPSGDKQTLTYGDISMQIDTNWKSSGDMVVLPVSTGRDAAISISNWKNESSLEYAGLHFAYLGLISSENFIPANTISITQYQDRTVLEYEVYDPQSQRYSVVNNMYFDVNEKMYIVSISAFKSVFYDNTDYFNNLLRSVQVKQE